MIEVDISNIWGSVSLPDLLGMEKDVFQAHLELTEENCPWLGIPGNTDPAMLAQLAEEIKDCSEILVILGGDGFAQGAQELLGGDGIGTRLIFVPQGFSSRCRTQLLRQLEGKSFSICLCGEIRFWDTLLLRELKWMLERRFGTDEANARIHSDPWGFLALAAGGVDLQAMLAGIREAAEEMDLRAYENPAWLYAGARHLLARNGGERLIYTEPELKGLCGWWQHLLSGNPISLCQRLERDFDSGNGLDTMLRFETPGESICINETAGDPGCVNFLAGRTLAQVEEAVWEALLEADLESDTPALQVQCAEPDARTLGQLFWFFRLAEALGSRLAERRMRSLEKDVLLHLGQPEC